MTTTTMLDALEADQAQMNEWFEHMHRTPELSMQEQQTAKYIADVVGRWGYEVETGIGKHGIVASMTVGDSGKAIGRVNRPSATQGAATNWVSTVP